MVLVWCCVICLGVLLVLCFVCVSPVGVLFVAGCCLDVGLLFFIGGGGSCFFVFRVLFFSFIIFVYKATFHQISSYVPGVFVPLLANLRFSVRVYLMLACVLPY